MEGLLEYTKMMFKYNDLKQLPKIAQKFIEMGDEVGVEIKIKYGLTEDKDKNLIAGFYIQAPKFGKAIFKQDIYLEDESEENYNEAIEYFKTALKQFQ